MKFVESELSFTDQIRLTMSHYPDWVFVREVSDSLYTPEPDVLSDIVSRGVFSRVLFPGIDLFFASVEPTYDEQKINALSQMPAADLIRHLDEDKERHFAGGHTNYETYEGYYWGVLSFKEILGSLKQSLINDITVASPHASKTLEQYGLRGGSEQSQSELARQISVHFMPSVPLAELIATSWEMYSIRDQKKQQFRVLPGAWGRCYAIPLKDISGIIHDESYLQKIADRTLEGYTVPKLQG